MNLRGSLLRMSVEFFKKKLERALSQKLGEDVRLENYAPVGGGCINSCYKLSTTSGDFFIKYNRADKFPGMFEAEARGLEILRTSGAVRIPKIILQQDFGNTSILVLEFLESGNRQQNFWRDFGANLARMHRVSNTRFGLDHHNYIGSIVQANFQHDTWNSFFSSERLNRQLITAIKNRHMEPVILFAADRLYSRLEQLIPAEPAALLHGDLWSGNYLTGPQGEACILDPAVYFGHREMDLAMTRLFGGFAPEFYEAYAEEFPLQPGFEERLELMQLYPLLVHVNLFGGGYVQQAEQILKKYSG